jgi:hypothetical protein
VRFFFFAVVRVGVHHHPKPLPISGSGRRALIVEPSCLGESSRPIGGSDVAVLPDPSLSAAAAVEHLVAVALSPRQHLDPQLAAAGLDDLADGLGHGLDRCLEIVVDGAADLLEGDGSGLAQTLQPLSHRGNRLAQCGGDVVGALGSLGQGGEDDVVAHWIVLFPLLVGSWISYPLGIRGGITLSPRCVAATGVGLPFVESY